MDMQTTTINNQVKLKNETMEKILLQGDLSSLDPQEKINYYREFCDHVGLDPVTRPFALMQFQTGRMELYCKKEGCQQLAKLNQITVLEKNTQFVEIASCIIYQVELKLQEGKASRIYISTGSEDVTTLKGKGKMISNMMMKAETKAFRRGVLNLSGLGLTDESEISSIENVETKEIDTETQPINNTSKKTQKINKPLEKKAEEIETKFDEPGPGKSNIFNDQLSVIVEKFSSIVKNKKAIIDGKEYPIEILKIDINAWKEFLKQFAISGMELNNGIKAKIINRFSHYVNRDVELLKQLVIRAGKYCCEKKYFPKYDVAIKYYEGIEKGKVKDNLLALIEERNMIYKLINEKEKK